VEDLGGVFISPLGSAAIEGKSNLGSATLGSVDRRT
jgi:hypothetical protein